MKYKQLYTGLAASAVFAAVCTYAVGKHLSAHPMAESPKLHYVAPKEPISSGEMVELSDLEMVDWPARSPIAGAFTRFDQVAGRVSLYPVNKDQPFVAQSLAALGSGIGLVSKIPDGMRAIAVRSDDVSGVDGFLFPGSHVDILLTYHAPGYPEPATVTVLQDVQVLAAGHQTEPDPTGKATTFNVVTVLVSPADAERVAMASSQGQVHFVLRNGGDEKLTAQLPVEASDLTGSPRPAMTQRVLYMRRPDTPVHVAHKAPQPEHYIITVADGEKDSRTNF